MYSGGNIFFYHASAYIDMYYQLSLGEAGTVISKELHELQTNEYGSATPVVVMKCM